MGLNPKGRDAYKLPEADNKKLIEELTKYAEEGATDAELKEFKDTFVAAKKKSTPSSAASPSTSQPAGTGSATKAGSSAPQKFRTVTEADLPAMQKQGQAPSNKQIQARTVKTDDGLYDFNGNEEHTDIALEVKAKEQKALRSSPRHTELYNEFKSAQTVAPEKQSEIAKEVEDEANGGGIWNNIKYGYNKLENFITENLAPNYSKERTSGEVAPLQKEKEQAKKELQEQNFQAKAEKQPETPITKEAISERAKQIAIDKRLKSQSDTQVRDFLADAQERKYLDIGESDKDMILDYAKGEEATFSLKDKENIKKQEILRPALETSASNLTNLTKQVQGYVDAGQPVPEELAQVYQGTYAQYQDILKDAIETQEEFLNNREDLGSVQENIDMLKRDYDWGRNFDGNLKAAALDIAGGIVGAAGYLSSLDPATKNTGAKYLLNIEANSIKGNADDMRNKLMKPISLDDINSPGDFGKWLSNTVIASQVPILALTATGAGGIAALGLSATGNKYNEMLNEQMAGQDYNDWQMALIPAAFGATETASAMVDANLLKGAARTMRAATQPERKLIAKGFVDSLFDAGKSVAKGTLAEGAEEGATQFAQNLIDIYAGDKKNVGLWDGVKDSAAAGAIMGAMIPASGGVTGVVAAAAKPFTTDSKIQDITGEILKFETALGNPELSEASRSVIEKQLTYAEAKQRSLVEKTVGKVSEMPNEEFEKIVKIERQKSRLKESAKEIDSDPSIDEATKKTLLDNLESDYSAAEQRRVEILTPKPVEATDAKPKTDDNRTNEVIIDETPVNSEEVNDVNDTNVVNIKTETNEGTPADVTAADGNVSTRNDGMDENGATVGESTISQEEQPASEPGAVAPVEAVDKTPEQKAQDDVNYALSELDKGVTLWDGNPYSTRINLGIDWADIRKGEKDLRAGKPNTVPAKRLTEALLGARERGEYDFIEGSGGKINRFRVRMDEMNAIQSEELTADEENEILANKELLAKEADEYLNTLNDDELNEIFGNYEQTESGEAGENAGRGQSEANVQDKEEPTEKRTGDFERKSEKKSVVNRLYEGETTDTVKATAEKLGLTYEVENQELAQKAAKQFVKEVGITSALESVRTGVIKGAEAAFVYNEVLEKIQEASDNADPLKREQIEEQYITAMEDAVRLFDEQARDSGRFISALNRIYNTSALKYALSRQVDRYKAANKGEIDDATMAKFKEADAKIKELEAKIKEAEKRAEEAEQIAAMANIVEEVERATKTVKTAKQKAKTLANKIRKAKITKPDAFNAATAGVVWDAAIEIVAKTIEAGGSLADAVAAGTAYIKKQEWYKGLTADKKSDALGQFESSIAATNTNDVVTVEDGVINIPNSVIRTLVEMGAKDIDTLAQKILDMISDEHPDITLRDVRDAITKYGKTINPTKDAIQKEINLMKRLGRLISANEDVDGGNRPQRSGLQREKPTQEERLLQKQLNEKMRDLSLDDADLEKQWKNTLDTIKSRLNNQIEDLEKQIAEGEKRKPEKTPVQYDAEANALREKRDALRDTLDAIAGKPELTEEQKVQRAINAMERSVEKLQKQIESGDIGFNPAPRTLSSPELNALKATRKKLTDELNALRKEAGLVEARKLEQAKKAVKKRIAELQAKIEDKDYTKRKPEPVKADDELLNLQAEKIKWQEVYDKAQYSVELRNRSVFNKSVDAIINATGIYRLLKATGELSTVLIQGGIQTVSLSTRKPTVYIKTFGKMFIALGSAKKAEQFEALMKANPNYPLMKASKLALSEANYKLELREEEFMGNWINNTWNFIGKALEKGAGKAFGVTETTPIGPKLLSLIKKEYVPEKKSIAKQFEHLNPISALERGSTVYMNLLRMERFNDGVTMLEMQGKNQVDHKGDYKKLAAAMNTLTGRANLGPLESQSALLNVIFFSFKNAVSTFNQTNPLWYLFMKDYKNGDKWYKASVAQKIAVYDMIRFITITTGMMYLIKSAAGDDEEGKSKITIETDPRSSDFMKLREGNIRFDAFHGMIPWVVFWSRMINDHTVKNGEKIRLGSGRYTPTRSDLIGKLITNKFSPQTGIAWRYFSTRVTDENENGDFDRNNAFGDPYDYATELGVTPMYIDAVNEIAKEDPDTVVRFLTVMGWFGLNSQVYESKKADSKSAPGPKLEKTY